MKRKSVDTIKSINNSDLCSEIYDTKEYENKFYSSYLKYNENMTNNDCKKYFLTYIKQKNKNIENYDFLLCKKYNPAGVYVKMESDGIKLPTSEIKYLNNFILELEVLNKSKIIKREQYKKEKNSKDILNVQNFLGDLNFFIDSQLTSISRNNKAVTDISGILKKYNFHPKYHEETKLILLNSMNEIKLVKTKKDEQLVEAYSYLTPKQLNKYIDFFKEIYSVIEKTQIQPVQTNVIRKVRVKKPEQLVKRVNIQTSCLITGLTSCPKNDIIGSSIIYVYNTKTRTLIQYKSDNGISVKGCTLLNISSSIKKKIRKPIEIFQNINPKSSIFMKKLWESIKTKESVAKQRISPCCILVSCLNYI